MLNCGCVVAGGSLCVLGDATNPYTRRGCLETPHGRYVFLLQRYINMIAYENANLYFSLHTTTIASP
jgi:hypothetical protein